MAPECREGQLHPNGPLCRDLLSPPALRTAQCTDNDQRVLRTRTLYLSTRCWLQPVVSKWGGLGVARTSVDMPAKYLFRFVSFAGHNLGMQPPGAKGFELENALRPAVVVPAGAHMSANVYGRFIKL